MTLIALKCFASPFDVGIDEEDRDQEISKSELNTVNDEENEDNNSTTNQPKNSITDINNDEEDFTRPVVDALRNSHSAKLEIIDLMNGQKYHMKIVSGEKKEFKNINFRLEKCALEFDTFYNKFSVALLIIDGKRLTLTNDVGLSLATNNKYLVSVECYE